MRIAQQGYEGSYHDIVRLHMYPESEMLGYDNFHEVVRAVHEGMADVGLVAIENSVYGDTPGALELRTNFDDLEITGETVLDITHRLFGVKGCEITEIRSHPVAIGQCRNTALQLHPGVLLEESTDTAVAIQGVAELAARGITNVAAIGSAAAGELHPDLDRLSDNMNDHNHNFTRFIAIQRAIDGLFTPDVDADKTSARLLLPDTKNSLLTAMEILSAYNIDYTSVSANSFRYDSRDGEVVTPIEFTHGWHDGRLSAAVEELAKKGIRIKYLGSYRTGQVIKV